MYDAAHSAGVDSYETPQEVMRVVVAIQSGAIPFTRLAQVFGAEITLGDLAALEQHIIANDPDSTD